MTHNQIKETLHKDGILLDDLDAAKLLKRHGVDFLVLDNGATVFASHKLDSDVDSAFLAVNFANGYSNDPKHKNGLYHLWEHTLYPEHLYSFIQMHACRSNANSGSITTSVYFSGFYLNQGSKFGFNPVFDAFTKYLLQDYYNLLNQNRIDYEKKAIIDEISGKISDYKYLSNQYFANNFIRTPKHYANNKPFEQLKYINNITIEDIKKVHYQNLKPSKAIVSILTTGAKNNLNSIVKKVEKIPSSGDKDIKHFDDAGKIIEYFKLGNKEYYEHDLGFKNNRADIFLVYCLDIKTYSSTHAAASILIDNIIRPYFMTEVRQRGLSYYPEVDTYRDELKYRYLVFSLNVASTDVQRLTQELIKCVNDILGKIDKKSKKVDDAMFLEKNFHKNVKITKQRITEQAVDFYTTYGMVPNIDLINKFYTNVKEAEIYQVLDYIKNIKPVKVVIGDIK